MTQRGFGLSEWMASVGAVVLLGAIALPIVLRNRDASSRVACMRNMKQIGAAISLYATDSDQTLPVTTQRQPRLGFGLHWSRTIQPYLASLEVFVCPADASPAKASFHDHTIEGQVPRLSYINNYAVIPAHDFYPVPSTTFTSPEQVIVIAERRSRTYLLGPLAAWKGTSGFFPGQPCQERSLGSGYERVTASQVRRALTESLSDERPLLIRANWSLHGQGSNYTFADGHAAYETLERSVAPDRFQWGERFYPRSKPSADCDGRARRKTPADQIPL